MKTPLALIALLMPCALQAQDQPQSDRTFAPKLVFIPNELLKYHFTMGMNMSIKTTGEKQLPLPPGVGEMKLDTTLRRKVAGVKPDGTAVLTMNTVGGKMTAMGNSVDMPEGQIMTMEIDKRGLIKQLKSNKPIQGPEMLQSMFSGQNFNNMPGFGVVLPDHPVKVGDTWEVDAPYPFGGGKLHMVNTLLGVEMVDGKETLKIKQVMSAPLDIKVGQSGIVTDESQAMMVMKGSMGGNSIQNIQESNGRMVKSAGEVSGKVVMEMKGEAGKQMEQQGFGNTINMDITGTMGMDLLSAGMVQPAPLKPTQPPKKPTAAKRSRG